MHVADLFTGKLAWFKQNEKPEAVLIVASNPELVKIVVAWSYLDIQIAHSLSPLTGDSVNEIWNWLWENIQFNITDLKTKAGVSYSESVLEQKMKTLTGNRIVYPDGEINSFVQRYMRNEVAKLFENKLKKTAKK